MNLDHLGGYVLPGGPLDARPAIEQANANHREKPLDPLEEIERA